MTIPLSCVTHGSVGVNIGGDKWKVARRTSRNRFKYRGVINVFNPISPFFDEKYMERLPFLSKMVHKRVMGLDFVAKLPRIKLC